MTQTTYAQERRSSRMFKRIRVVAAGKNQHGRRYREACETIVINVYGGLLCIPQPLEMDAPLALTNPFTQEEQECRVVHLGEESDKGWRIGVEFLTPAPRFWGVEFSAPAQPAAPVPTPVTGDN